MQKSPFTQQTVFLTLGYPGAGKSYLARQLAESLGLVRVSADRIRYELFENPSFSRDEDAIVFRILDYMMEEALKAGHNVICDADFGLRKSRRLKYEMARKYKATSVVLWVQTDLESSFVRASSRDGRNPDDKYSFNLSRETFDRLVAKLKKPEKEPVVVVSGKHVFKVQMTNILRRLQQTGLVGIPERPAEQDSKIPARKPMIERRQATPGRPLKIGNK